MFPIILEIKIDALMIFFTNSFSSIYEEIAIIEE